MREEICIALQRLVKNDDFLLLIEHLETRYGAMYATLFVPGDPYSTAYNEGARSVVAYVRRLVRGTNDRGSAVAE